MTRFREGADVFNSRKLTRYCRYNFFKNSAIRQKILYFDKTEVSYSIEDDYRDESNELLTEICEENSDNDEEPSDVEPEEGTAPGTEEIIWY